MNKSAIQEAYDHADAARLNLETAFARPEAKHAGLIRNARQQLAKALKILEDAEFDAAQTKKEPKEPEVRNPASHALEKLVTWTKAGGGVEIAQLGVFQLAITGMRGDWYYTVTRSGEAKPTKTGNEKSKATAKLEAIGWADTLAEEDERVSNEKRAAGVGYDKLADALERARGNAGRSKLSCGYDGSAPATLDDVHSVVDSFVADLIHSLDPEPG